MATLPAPTNRLVTIVNIVLDYLIQGLGAPAAIAAATAAQPWLGWPVISWIFKTVVNGFAALLDTKLKTFVDVIIVRFQNAAIKIDYDKAIDEFKKVYDDPASDAVAKAKALQAAKDAIDRMVNKNR